MGDIEGPLESQSFPKVCIIDDGVNLNEDYTIEAGRSFGQQSNISTNPGECFPSTGGHGTSMANIIHSICPRAKFYVAKLEGAVGRGKFTLKDAAKAVEWPIKQDVDIISMSWTIDDASPEDIEAFTSATFAAGPVKKASGHNDPGSRKPPIMFCASRDQGKEAKGKTIYPYSCAPDAINRIGAVDEYGAALSHTSKDVDYLLPCQGLDMSIMDDSKRIREGSSEATALAAGLAALILACEAPVTGRKGSLRNPRYMKLIFDSMASDHKEGPKYVLPTLFDEAAQKKYPRDPSVEPIIQRMAEVLGRCHGFLKSKGITAITTDSQTRL